MLTVQNQRHHGETGHQKKAGRIRPGGSQSTKPRNAVSEIAKGLHFLTMQNLRDGKTEKTGSNIIMARALRVAMRSLHVLTLITYKYHGAQAE
jgi:hypothetical protein